MPFFFLTAFYSRERFSKILKWSKMVKVIKDHIKKSPCYADNNKFEHFSWYDDLSSLNDLTEEFN